MSCIGLMHAHGFLIVIGLNEYRDSYCEIFTRKCESEERYGRNYIKCADIYKHVGNSATA